VFCVSAAVTSGRPMQYTVAQHKPRTQYSGGHGTTPGTQPNSTPLLRVHNIFTVHSIMHFLTAHVYPCTLHSNKPPPFLLHTAHAHPDVGPR